MKIPIRWLETIQRLHHELVSGSSADEFGLSRSASITSVLPLAVDMGGFFGIRLDAEVVGFIYDNLDSPIKIEDRRIFNSILYQGSKIYPELMPLVPVRPNDAITCPSCHGTGVISGLPDKLKDKVVCFCGGLGWIPGLSDSASEDGIGADNLTMN